MQSIQPLVDQFGNINLHMEEDLYVPIAGGENVGDLSVRKLVFRIPARSISYTVEPNPHDPTGALIRMTAAQLKKVRTGDSFVLLDQTASGNVARWEGIFKRRG